MSEYPEKSKYIWTVNIKSPNQASNTPRVAISPSKNVETKVAAVLAIITFFAKPIINLLIPWEILDILTSLLSISFSISDVYKRQV